jgi:hypothetical protein
MTKLKAWELRIKDIHACSDTVLSLSIDVLAKELVRRKDAEENNKLIMRGGQRQ